MNADLSFINCTIANNTTGVGGTYSGGQALRVLGGGIYSAYQLSTVNTILWNNTDRNGTLESSQILVTPGTPTVNYCDVQGWTGTYGGVGNIGLDPLFADADLHLASGSPCLNAGDNAAIPPGVTTDLEGNPRIVDGVVDMGAYEIQPPVVPGDFDGDGDGDQTDFGEFQLCLSLPAEPGCQKADMDGSGLVDQDDSDLWQGCASGPNVPANPQCAD